ncbi:hypothetical protein DL991_41025 [Amycolatopsis sp. WAC 01375]|uniref:hypothetical protein n=1 Tax=Amycolatopsis sp. WAC 01375 TaxID=2203194 RepID=UPI000F77537C|nr:hypothetical protein [Amycolatopsis sp. WAC 01375]RSM68959.1 hypothetical protein DL991_41025 [Amycolatopsis sp. WAC 01375]
MDAHVPFESWLERDTAMVLNFQYDVVSFATQPIWLLRSDTGRALSRTLAFFARTAKASVW